MDAEIYFSASKRSYTLLLGQPHIDNDRPQIAA